MNIIDVEAARQDRLFLFMFGGKDAQMQPIEMERKEAYLTRVMEVIYVSIGEGKCQKDDGQVDADGKKHYQDIEEEGNWPLAISAMMTFNHLDVQRLVVEEYEKKHYQDIEEE